MNNCNDILDKIGNALLPFGNIFRGAFPREKEIKEIDDCWDYIVFRKKTPSRAETLIDFRQTYEIAIVRENEIPSYLVFAVIKAVQGAIPRLKFKESSSYEQGYKGNTDLQIEIVLLTFAEQIKGCEICG
ncbi:MAG: hypothetical protein MJ120_00200 [Clostridia bacterium]|nr:hypothetical protein [Clostridia bacterium]